MTGTNTNSQYKTNFWLSNKHLGSLFSSEYWNDKQIEESKEWYILDGDFTKMERYLQESHLLPDLMACMRLAERSNRPVQGVGADLAAGVLWAVPPLLENHAISKIYCLEMSQHRLLEIGPAVLTRYDIPPDKVELCLGSFYDIKLPDDSLDFLVLVQAFHHAEEPDKLLREMRRVLKDNGVALIVGEHKIKQIGFLKRQRRQIIYFLISYFLPINLQQRLFGRVYPKQSPFVPLKQPRPLPDTILGDHYYFLSDYQDMFARNGFEMVTETTKNPMQYFVIWPQTENN